MNWRLKEIVAAYVFPEHHCVKLIRMSLVVTCEETDSAAGTTAAVLS